MQAAANGADGGESMMIINRTRIGYLGRTGTHDVRVIGACAVYVSLRDPFTIAHRGQSHDAYFAVVPAHEMHRVSSPDRYGAQLLIEPETTLDPIVSGPLTMPEQRQFAERIIAGFDIAHKPAISADDFDMAFFGRVLAPRRLDRRIRASIDRVCSDPAAKNIAEVHARLGQLSVSRFSHLFRSEVGSTFRRFCAWKRARGIMPLVCSQDKLVETALSAGYADSTHFSHSVRQFFGIRPRDLVDILAARDFQVISSQASTARRFA